MACGNPPSDAPSREATHPNVMATVPAVIISACCMCSSLCFSKLKQLSDLALVMLVPPTLSRSCAVSLGIPRRTLAWTSALYHLSMHPGPIGIHNVRSVLRLTVLYDHSPTDAGDSAAQRATPLRCTTLRCTTQSTAGAPSPSAPCTSRLASVLHALGLLASLLTLPALQPLHWTLRVRLAPHVPPPYNTSASPVVHHPAQW